MKLLIVPIKLVKANLKFGNGLMGLSTRFAVTSDTSEMILNPVGSIAISIPIVSDRVQSGL